MHRRSPCRCTSASRAAPLSRGWARRRATGRSRDYRRAKKDRRAPNGKRGGLHGTRRARAAAGPAPHVTAA
ncbi:hypothetical protein DB771_07165 [Burkholderia sp. AU29985]|nr:hypothetical protein EGY28_15180 [Burkholderia dolosa]PRE44973.1 hypothetical protein C6P87_21740 [Burkholderia sp. AU12872]PUA77398.1 hypothetical protein DB771_07165 [Burkholderia sp. AU29985]